MLTKLVAVISRVATVKAWPPVNAAVPPLLMFASARAPLGTVAGLQFAAMPQLPVAPTQFAIGFVL